MKQTIIVLMLAFFGWSMANAQVGIGTTTPDAKAELELMATNKGFLPTRMTTAERNAIPSPPAGLTIFNEETNSIEFSDGTDWINPTDRISTPINITPAPTGYGNVGIGTTTPNVNAVLDIVSTTKGFLPPRTTTVAISSPVDGLLIYDTADNCLKVYDGLASTWKSLCERIALPPPAPTAPNPPVITAATAGDSQATITFDAPTYDGGDPITSYTATASPGDITTTVTQAGGGTITVTGLTNGTTYSITVTATNSIGTSNPSNAVNVTPATVPDSPVITAATAGDAQVTITFTAPVDDGGSTITSYTATSSPGSITATVNQAGSGNIIVTGLTNYTAYTFTVTATNAVGTSSPSASSASATPSPCAGQPASITHDGKTYIPIESGEYCWLDRNLGADRKAQSKDDTQSYGDLYQWGRKTDGHEKRSSTAVLGPVTEGSEGTNFIRNNQTQPDGQNGDWLVDSESNNFRWNQGNLTNDPCPTGFRVPLRDEFVDERASWSPQDPDGAHASPLKWALAGDREGDTGAKTSQGQAGYYWSMTTGTFGTEPEPRSSAQFIFPSFIGDGMSLRANGYSVRCIKQ